MSATKKRQLATSKDMDIDIPFEDDHTSKRRRRRVDKLSNDISNNLHLNNNTDKGKYKDEPMVPKEENILVLLERMSKNKEMRNNKECMDTVAQLLQQRFELSAKLESHKSCDNS